MFETRIVMPLTLTYLTAGARSFMILILSVKGESGLRSNWICGLRTKSTCRGGREGGGPFEPLKEMVSWRHNEIQDVSTFSTHLNHDLNFSCSDFSPLDDILSHGDD